MRLINEFINDVKLKREPVFFLIQGEDGNSSEISVLALTISKKFGFRLKIFKDVPVMKYFREHYRIHNPAPIMMAIDSNGKLLKWSDYDFELIVDTLIEAKKTSFLKKISLFFNFLFAFTKQIIQRKDTILASKKIIEKRMSVCNGCPYNKNGGCVQCGCKLSLKTKLTASKCPIGSW